MGAKAAIPYDQLERVFHEPNRLAIMSALAAADGGVPFTELKRLCRLTDGNLNRHLKVLRDAGVVRIEKKFIQEKPLTTAWLTRRGLDRFEEYLAALQQVLRAAQKSLGPEAARESGGAGALQRSPA